MTGTQTRHGDGQVLYGLMDLNIDTWTAAGHPELEGEPTLATWNGLVQVPPRPPEPGPRYADGAVYP